MPTKILTTSSVKQTNIFAVIYGEDGVGKSTFALTADKPIWAAYDLRGLVRPSNRKEALKFKDWEDIADYFDVYGDRHRAGQLSPFRIDYPYAKTLIHDTVGIMLDEYIVKHVSKISGTTRSDGSLSMNGYGAMKHLFSKFIEALGRIDCDHVFVCHAVAPKEDGEDGKIRPRISGGSYNILLERADMCGFIDVQKGRRNYDFNQDGSKVGKNTGKIAKGQIKDDNTSSFKGILGKLIQQTKDVIRKNGSPNQDVIRLLESLGSVYTLKDYYKIIDTAVGTEYAANEIDRVGYELWRDKAEACETVEDFNEFIKLAKKRSMPRSSDVKQILRDKAEEFGMVYSSSSGRYQKAEVEEAETVTSQQKESDSASIFDDIASSIEEVSDKRVLEQLKKAAKARLSEEDYNKIVALIESKSETLEAA